jgi:hypothetical protein
MWRPRRRYWFFGEGGVETAVVHTRRKAFSTSNLRLNRKHPLAKGLRLALPISEGGGDPHDFGDWGNHGTRQGVGGANNLPQWQSTGGGVLVPSPRCLNFDDTDDVVSVGQDLGASQATLTAWVKPSFGHTGTAIHVICGDSDGGSPQSILIGYNGYTAKRFFYAQYRGDYGTLVLCEGNQFNSDTALQTWHHVCGTFNQPASEVKIYVDGVLEATDSSATNAWGNGVSGFQIGARNGGDFWGGDICDAFVYHRVFPLSEVQELYYDGGAKWRPRRRYWFFGEEGIVTATVSPVVMVLTAIGVAARGHFNAPVSPKLMALTPVEPTPTFFADGIVSPELLTLTAVEPAGAVTFTASVSPVSLVLTSTDPAPSFFTSGTVVPKGLTLTPVDPTALTDQQLTGNVSPVALSLSSVDPTPSFFANGTVSPEALTLLPVDPTPNFIVDGTVTPLGMVITPVDPTVSMMQTGNVSSEVMTLSPVDPTGMVSWQGLVSPVLLTLIVVEPTVSVASLGLVSPVLLTLIVVEPTGVAGGIAEEGIFVGIERTVESTKLYRRACTRLHVTANETKLHLRGHESANQN